MNEILDDMLREYDSLLEYYEKMYDNFKSAISGDADEYVTIMDKNSGYIGTISTSQKNIESLRTELKKSISSDMLIDSFLDEYSCGRVSDINNRIEYIIKSIQEHEENGKAALEEEMERIACGLEDIGVLNFKSE